MDYNTFDQIIEEIIAAKDAERKAAEEDAAAEALEWESALREADEIARRNHARRTAALNDGIQISRSTQAVRRTQESPVTSDHHTDSEARSSRYTTSRPMTPAFSDSDLRPTRKRKRLGSR